MRLKRTIQPRTVFRLLWYKVVGRIRVRAGISGFCRALLAGGGGGRAYPAEGAAAARRTERGEFSEMWRAAQVGVSGTIKKTDRPQTRTAYSTDARSAVT